MPPFMPLPNSLAAADLPRALSHDLKERGQLQLISFQVLQKTSRSLLISSNSARQVANDLGGLLHGEVDLIQIIEHPLHLLGLPVQGLSCLGANLYGILYNLRKQQMKSQRALPTA